MVKSLVVAGLFLHCFFGGVVLAKNPVLFELSASIPSDISKPIDRSFAGFGIEPSNLFSFTGGDEPNALTFNLIDNLASYTGKPPHIRIGGNTADYMVFDETQSQWIWKLNDHPRGHGSFKPNHMVIGPRFFEAADRFPSGTPITWGLNLAYEESDWQQQITTMATQVLNSLENVDVVSFEIGNEPDLYLQNGFRVGQWGGRKYSEAWLQRAKVVWENVLKPKGIHSNFFEVGCTASTIGTDFQIKDLLSFDIDKKATHSDVGYISSWNQHDYYFYIGVSSYDLTLDDLMRLSTTEDQFKAWTDQVSQSKTSPFPYALREMGVVGPIGMAGVTDTFGAAIWTLNFLLYAASLDIASVQFHMTDNSKASAWQPIEESGKGPFVRPLYYGIAAFDQTIGASCSAQVSRVRISSYPAGYDQYIRAYGVYQGGELSTLVVLNGKMANVSRSDKNTVHMTFKVPSSLSGRKLHLSYLTSDGADATEGTTWNGISYEKNGDGTATRVSDDDETVTIERGGTVSLPIRDSQAIVANIDARVGEGEVYDTGACPASKSSEGDTSESAESEPIRKGSGDEDSAMTTAALSRLALFSCVSITSAFLLDLLPAI